MLLSPHHDRRAWLLEAAKRFGFGWACSFELLNARIGSRSYLDSGLAALHLLVLIALIFAPALYCPKIRDADL